MLINFNMEQEFWVICLYTKLLHGVRSKDKQVLANNEQIYPESISERWQVKVHIIYRVPRSIGLKIQTYTSSSKTGGKRQNSCLTQCSLTSEVRRQTSSLSVCGLERRPAHTSACGRSGQKRQSKDMLDTLKDWTRPKSDEVAAFTQLRALNQGNKTLSTYIQEVRRVVDLCNFSCMGDCKDRLIRNSIMAGLNSSKAY